MTISMYQVSVPVFLRSLNALSGVLDKAAALAEGRKLDQAVLLGLRLYPDMFPLNVQVGQVCTHAARGVRPTRRIDAARVRRARSDDRGSEGSGRQDDRFREERHRRPDRRHARTRRSCSNSARAR